MGYVVDGLLDSLLADGKTVVAVTSA
ncbi:enoyl-CoA hydratase [Janibacter sp. HTCC2649]|nr:enoyl-CoA hydratase [Janibacter sp. HTCC2649]